MDDDSSDDDSMPPLVARDSSSDEDSDGSLPPLVERFPDSDTDSSDSDDDDDEYERAIPRDRNDAIRLIRLEDRAYRLFLNGSGIGNSVADYSSLFPNGLGVGNSSSSRGGRAPAGSIDRLRVVVLREEGVVFPRECCVRFKKTHKICRLVCWFCLFVCDAGRYSSMSTTV